MDNKEAPKLTYPCQDCQAGVRHLRYLTYFTWLRDQLITVPNFPAWVCDVCGKRDYDVRAISWLNTLLNTTERSTKPRLRWPIPGPDSKSSAV